MLLAAAVVPVPPLLVPQIAGGSAERDDDLRSATFAAVCRVLATGPDRVVVVGEARDTGPLEGEPDWHPFGVPLPRPRPMARLPLAHSIGAWVLGEVGCAVPVAHLGVASDVSPETCTELGRRLASDGGRTALIACGDGTARRDEKAPGHFSPSAADFDARVDAALRAGDPAGLLALGVEEARELWVSGRTAWQVLAGATGGGSWDAEVTYADEPYGVHYAVATWLRRAG
ncbi:MAG: hypothetical protein QOJ68_1925 [Blastococcus sp.]|nr:hypothetical protein [Blastococcus sp.]